MKDQIETKREGTRTAQPVTAHPECVANLIALEPSFSYKNASNEDGSVPLEKTNHWKIFIWLCCLFCLFVVICFLFLFVCNWTTMPQALATIMLCETWLHNNLLCEFFRAQKKPLIRNFIVSGNLGSLPNILGAKAQQLLCVDIPVVSITNA